MWPFNSDDDVYSVSSDSDSSWNNLNIPPEASGGSWLSKVGQLFYLLGPIALAYVHWRDKEEQQKISEDVTKERLTQDARLSQLVDIKNFQREKAKVIKEEEARAAALLQQLNKIEDSIKVFLDIRCSQLNPWKTRYHREEIENDLLTSTRENKALARFGVYEGMQQIIMYDYLHCADGFNNNGQIYRVWMTFWRAQVNNQKEQQIAARLEEMYNNLSKMN